MVSLSSERFAISTLNEPPTFTQATRDPFYLDVGERILFDLITRSKVDCGLAGIQDLRTNKRDDRMESFALSETLKVSVLKEALYYLVSANELAVPLFTF